MCTTQPLISVIIPSYNRSELIKETLDSVHSQSYQNWECIIVDDGSTDGSQEIITRYVMKDELFRFFQRNREPKGAPTCRNIGIEKSEGDYFIFLDSDDLLADNCLENRIKNVYLNTNYDFWVFGTYVFYDKPGDSSDNWNLLHKDNDDLFRFILYDNPWGTGGPLWKKQTVQILKGYDESAYCWQDWEFHIRAIVNNFRYWKCNEDYHDLYYRKRALNLSDEKHHLIKLKSLINLFEKIEPIISNNRTDKKKIQSAIGNLYFKFLINLNDKNAIELVLEFTGTKTYKRIFVTYERILLKIWMRKLTIQKFNYLKNIYIVNLLKLLNREKFSSKYDSTYCFSKNKMI